LKYGKECSIQTQSTFDIEFIFVVYTMTATKRAEIPTYDKARNLSNAGVSTVSRYLVKSSILPNLKIYRQPVGNLPIVEYVSSKL